MSIASTYANYSPDWWTPEPWLDWATATLGEGWFDPCPGDWRKDFDVSGLDTDWESRCYVNHPGSRGSTAPWWAKAIGNLMSYRAVSITGGLIWCAFNVEQLRHMQPSPFHLPGWLVMPEERTPFVWGGPNGFKGRTHGEPAKSPGNWAVWWSTEAPANPPVKSVIVRTG